jgi:enterochelin esterase-like enzyme
VNASLDTVPQFEGGRARVDREVGGGAVRLGRRDRKAVGQRVRGSAEAQFDHLLWLGAGSAEECFGTAIQAMHAALDQAGVKHVVFTSPGTAHEWQTWRRSLYDFAPRLFRSGDHP